jgi:serine/threonine protein kinase
MLREVRTLEQIRHVNIIDYKHCWIESHQLTTFGPAVPCLFILMEFANGGNLEEFVVTRYIPQSPHAKRRRRAPSPLTKKPKQLRPHEIWNFFLDICAGLDHLHRHGILHRGMPFSCTCSFHMQI